MRYVVAENGNPGGVCWVVVGRGRVRRLKVAVRGLWCLRLLKGGRGGGGGMLEGASSRLEEFVVLIGVDFG